MVNILFSFLCAALIYRNKNILESKVGSEGKTEFWLWPQNRASAFSRQNPQGLDRVPLTMCDPWMTSYVIFQTQLNFSLFKQS